MSSPELAGSGAPSPRGDTDAAFEAMVRAHYAALGAFAYRLVGSRTLAEDVVHEILLRIWRRRDHFDFDNVLPYLYRAVRNEADSSRRRNSRLVAIGEHEDGRPDPQRTLELDDLARVVQDIVAAMPARRREIFRMQREQGRTYAEIAELLGISIKTVEAQMGRALKAIRLRAVPFLILTVALLQ
jgi:RNA polymerase sigma-70 factor, ECF subfamily